MKITVTQAENAGVRIPISLQDFSLEVPVYSLMEVPELHCAMYARKVASDLFQKNFSICSAWNRKYHDQPVASVNGNTLKDFARRNILREGMIIGVFNPGSRFLQESDEQGRNIEYTHNALFLGRDSKGQIVIAEQIENQVLIRTEQIMRNEGYIPKEIFDEPT